MQPFSDLNAILQDGYSFQTEIYEGMYRVPQTSTISTHRIGDLILTSGKILACDLLIVPDSRYYFIREIKPGRYPIILSVADFQPSGDTRIACAMMQITDEPTIKWEVATINNPDPNQTEQIISYGVDSGTGCFMDLDAAEAVNNQFPELDEFEEFCDQITTAMEKNSFSEHRIGHWADARINNQIESNIIIFSSGWGDGGYASFWGYGASGNVTCLVTDFALFPTVEAS